LSVFAPRNAAEIARILAPSGILVVATPAEDQLGGPVSALGTIGVGTDKPARLLAQLEPHMRLVPTEAAETAVMLDPPAVAAVALTAEDVGHRPRRDTEPLGVGRACGRGHRDLHQLGLVPGREGPATREDLKRAEAGGDDGGR